MNRLVFVLSLTLLVAMVAWGGGSPYWTLHQIKSGMVANDADKVARYVDFEALRADLKSDLKANVMTEVSTETDGFAVLGAGLAMALIDPMIDGMVSPSGLKAMMSNAPGVKKPVKGNDLKNPKVVRTSFNTFEVVTGEAPEEVSFLFERRGLGWRLVGADVPFDAPGAQ